MKEIATVKRVNTFIECGSCGAYHRTDFYGDCREDSERFYNLPDHIESVLSIEEQIEEEKRH